MAEKATIARPYARAAFAHARERGALAAWSGLLAAGAALAAAQGAKALIGNPRVTDVQLVNLVAGVASDAGVTVGADGRNFLAALAHNHRLAFLPQIAAQFEALRAEAEQVLDVEVRSARPLEPAQRARLAEALARRFARKVRLAEAVDGALIGGAVVRAGDLVIDGSLQGRLARLARQVTRP